MNTTDKGDLTKIMLMARFMQLGWIVLNPLSENLRYDLVIDRGNGFERVQCKTGRFSNGCVIFNTFSVSNPHLGGKRRNYIDEVELFGSFCQETQKCYLVPINKVGTEGRLRVDDPKRLSMNDKYPIRWAKDFEI